MALKLSSNLSPVDKKVPKKEKDAEKKKSIATATGNSYTANEILEAIKKDKGDKVVVVANSIKPVRRLPTGIFELDYWLGGGFPCGRYSIIYGPESSNKTNIALKAVISAQKLPPPCNLAIWVNIEQTFDPIWAAKMGVDTDKLLVVNAGYGEEAIDMIDALVRAEDVALLVVDSIAALVASKEIAQSIENYDVGTSALLIKRAVNKLMYAFGEEIKKNHDPCVILINQTRFKPGVLFGDPETMPGGEAQKFLCSLRIRTYAKSINLENQLMYKETHVVVKKAKVLVRAVDFTFKLCMLPNCAVRLGDTDSFLFVKEFLQSLNKLVKTGKGFSVEGVDMVCGACKGKGCSACSGKGKLLRVWPKLSDLQDEYRSSAEFSAVLQKIVIDSSHEMILVDEPDEHAPKEVEPGHATPIAI